MAKLSDNALLKRAIEPAFQDRVSLAAAYGRGAPEAASALEEARAIKALAGVSLKKMSAEQLAVAALAFIYAEQWESSLADALPKGVERKHASASATAFQEARHRIWGKTRMEVFLDTAKPVRVFPPTDSGPSFAHAFERVLNDGP
jgi:hypothetical protein